VFRSAQAAIVCGFAAASWIVTSLLLVGPGLEGAVALGLVFTLAGLTVWIVAVRERTPAQLGLTIARMFLAAIGFIDVALSTANDA